MEETGRLSNIIASRLEEHQRGLAEQQKQTDRTMKELLEQRERFSVVSRRIMEAVVHPRVAELLRHFDNAAITDHHGDTDFIAFASFPTPPGFLPPFPSVSAFCQVKVHSRQVSTSRSCRR